MKSWFLLIGCLFGIGTLLAACAGDSEPGAGTEPGNATTTTPTTEPASAEQPVAQATLAPTTDVAPAPSPEPADCRGDSAGLAEGRTDIRPSGNRHAPGGIDLLTAPMSTVQLSSAVTWIVPIIEDQPCRPAWYVTLGDGSAVIVDPDGVLRQAGDAATPPESSSSGVVSANDALAQFNNPLPDGRVVTFDRWTAALVEPTDRYGHGVLGDEIEAGAIEIIDDESGERSRIVIEPPSVIEGISPMLLDVDQEDDGVPEILVTVSNSDRGAWLALYNLDGTLRAQSAAIGRGNRWRNQLGGGFTNADGVYEIVDVRTPHLDGVVEFFRLQGDRLEPAATTSGYTSHVIGSRNLDMGILIDANEDNILEVVLPTRDLSSLAVLARIEGDVVELGLIELDGRLNSNVAAQSIADQAWVAIGTQDGRLIIFGDTD